MGNLGFLAYVLKLLKSRDFGNLPGAPARQLIS
jgi:hypothetical protein